jgi:tetratricopeptide (TPR) repeat protein
MKKWFYIFSIVIVAYSPVVAAKTLSELTDSMNMLDFSLKRVEKLITTAKKVSMGSKFNAMKRFLNGVYLLKNNRPQNAAALFMSLIDHPKLGKEATFYYSEAMYQSRNFLVAAEFYKKVMIQNWDKQFRAKAIKRILEISMKTASRDKQQISDLIKIIMKVIEEAPEIKNYPEVKYAFGKYAYFQATEEFKKPAGTGNESWGLKRYHEALKLFDSIKPTVDSKGKTQFPKLYSQSVYYSGATLVKLASSGAVSFTRGSKTFNLEDYTSSVVEMRESILYEAISKFSILAGTKDMVKMVQRIKKRTNVKSQILYVARNKADQDIAVLSRLAIGRIFYELGQTGESIKWYKTVSSKSKSYEDALYEMAWVYVRESEVMKAVQTLAIMELRNKNSIFLPRARLLLGYLKIRGEQWVSASKSFNKTSRRYKGVYKKLTVFMAKKLDPEIFYNQIMSKKSDKKSAESLFKAKYNIPKEAIPIFKEDRNLMKAILISGDIRIIKKSLKEASSALQIIKRRLQSASKVSIFPILNSARKKTYEYEFKNMELRGQLVKIAVKNFSHLLTGGTKTSLKSLDKIRKNLEKKIETMPKSTDSLDKKLRKKRKVFDDKLMNVDNLKKDLLTQQQFLLGLYKYYQKLPLKKKNKLKGVIEKFHKESVGIKASLEMADVIRSRIVDESLEIGVDDDDMTTEKLVRKNYRDSLKKVFALFSSVRNSMSSTETILYDKIITLIDKSYKLDMRMDHVNGRIYLLADTKLEDIKTKVSEEEKNIKGYKTQYTGYTSRSKNLSQIVSADSLHTIASKFQNIVMEADLGVVDVSWSKRSLLRGKWARLNSRKSKITKELKSRFSEVEDSKIVIEDKKFIDPFETPKTKKRVKVIKKAKSKKKTRGTK